MQIQIQNLRIEIREIKPQKLIMRETKHINREKNQPVAPLTVFWEDWPFFNDIYFRKSRIGDFVREFLPPQLRNRFIFYES